MLVVLLLPAAAPAQEPGPCSLDQVTDELDGPAAFTQVSASGTWVVWEASTDPEDDSNVIEDREVFLYDTTTDTLAQITDNADSDTHRYPDLSLNGEWVLFNASEDLAGENPGDNLEIFRYHRPTGTLSQLTETATGDSVRARTDGTGTVIAIESRADLDGTNADGTTEIFFTTDGGTTFTAITDSLAGESILPVVSPDGEWIAFASTADPVGDNADANLELFVYEVDAAELTQLTSTAGCSNRPVSDFGPAFDQDGDVLLFTSGCDLTGGNADGSMEVFLADLSDESFDQLMASGIASDAFGISANGRWVLLSTQIGFVPDPPFELLLFDRMDDSSELIGDGVFVTGAGLDASATLLALVSNDEVFVANCPSTPVQGDFFTDPEFPDFRFRVVIDPPTGPPIAGAKEEDCQEDTVCVSGAVPERPELFIRILGPRPNGFLWPTLVRFTPSAVTVEIVQESTGDRQIYQLDAVPPGQEELCGLQDRMGFQP